MQKFMQKWLYPGCFLFVIVTVVLLTVGKLADLERTPSLSLRMLLCFLGFSLCLSFARYLLTRQDLGGVTVVLAHYLACVGSFLLFVLLLTGYAIGRGYATVVASILFTAVYAIWFLIYSLVTARKKKKQDEKRDYTPKFKR